MTVPAPQALAFQAGGPLRNESLYVERSADVELPRFLRQGELCFCLAPRQMGKSSLRERTAERLHTEGFHCISIDLTAIGGETSAAPEWYFGLLSEFVDKLPGYGLDAIDCWERLGDTTHAQRLVRFFRDELLAHVEGQVIVFIDEIDAVRALPFSSDEFFAALRAVSISNDPAFSRLTFCLLGVVQPGDLIQRQDVTSFNVGKNVPLTDFTRSEVEPFALGLSSADGDPRKLLDAVYNWTSGHPYMMQRLCEAIVLTKQRGDLPKDERRRVAALVDELFLQHGQATDSNLGYAQKKFERQYRTPRVARMLEQYSRLLHRGSIAATGQDESEGDLLLAGMASVRQGHDGPLLVVRNRIFAAFFDAEWTKSQQQDRLFGGALSKWIEFGRDDRFVLRGAALHDADSWALARNDLTQDEHSFLHASMRVENHELTAQALAQQAQLLAEASTSAERASEVHSEREKGALAIKLAGEQASSAAAERALVEAEHRYALLDAQSRSNRQLTAVLIVALLGGLYFWNYSRQLMREAQQKATANGEWMTKKLSECVAESVAQAKRSSAQYHDALQGTVTNRVELADCKEKLRVAAANARSADLSAQQCLRASHQKSLKPLE